MWPIISVVLIIIVCCSSTIQSSDGIAHCKVGDTSCMVNYLNLLTSNLTEGKPEWGIEKFDPVDAGEIVFVQGVNSPVNVKIKFSNTKILGLKYMHFHKIIGFNEDPNGKYEIHFKVPRVETIASYEMSGQVLVVPIEGSGKTNITIVGPNITLKFTGKGVERDGKTYLTMDNMSFRFKAKRAFFNFGNLYGGNNLLSDTTNKFINDNWKEILRELKDPIDKAYSGVCRRFMENVFNKFPYDELFVK